MSLETELREVLALSEKATPGPWTSRLNASESAFHIRGDDLHLLSMSWHARNREHYPLRDESEANAKTIVAAVNFLRQHGPALMQAIEDAQRYQQIRNGFGRLYYIFDDETIEHNPNSKIAQMTLDNALDIAAARAAEKGEGNEP